MPTVSFGQKREEVAVVETPQKETALATIPNQTPQFEGERDSSLLKTPYLALVSNRSNVASDHPEWINNWVYNKEAPLGKEVLFVPINLRRYYKENVEFDSGAIPRRWERIADAKAETADDGAQFVDAGDIRMFVELPETNSDERLIDSATEINGKLYLPVMYSVQSKINPAGSRYDGAFGIFKTLATDLGRSLKGDLTNGIYLLGYLKKDHPKGAYLVPTIKRHGSTTAEFRAALAEKLR
jgi:hypothetical protein